KQFRVREIKLPDLGYVLVSTTNLNDVLMINGSEYVSDEAQKIDEQIYFFVEENEIELNEKELTKIVGLEAI
ncbi:MAG TPA: hypothetical protein VFM79_04520, partial [Pelobium sp.]|nr:hypothetical protein [Pelobium sp.]